jgi:hypothetical protein
MSTTPEPAPTTEPDPSAGPDPQPGGTDWRNAGIAMGAVLVVLVIVGAVVAVTHRDSPADRAASQARIAEALAPSRHIVVYELTTTGAPTSADITYSTPSGTGQQQGVDVPLTSKNSGSPGITLTDVASGQFLYLSGQLKDGDQDLTCRITVDGKVVAENTSSGEFSIVSCKATA